MHCLDSVKNAYSLKKGCLTLRNDQSGVALRVPHGKRLDNTVDLLRLAGKADMH